MNVQMLWPFLLGVGLLVSCGAETSNEEAVGTELTPQNLAPEQQNSPLSKIAIGSCNRQDAPQTMWSDILENQPELWIWLGDNIYGDSEDMAVIEKKYKLQLSHPEYQAFIDQVPIIGIWDDHDYGVNDGDKNYPKKEETKTLMLDFLGVPKDAEVRNRPGAYQSFTYGPEDQQIKVILLDGRSFRDELTKETKLKNRRYLPNEEGDMLGEAQWAWLAEELTDSKAKVHLIGCGIQFLPEQHGYEKWANFPKARQRLFNLIKEKQVERPILMSGDRHIAEVSAIQIPGYEQKVYELTASGLTHSYEKAKEENKHRVGPLIRYKNFGIIDIDWSEAQPAVTLSIHGEKNQVFHSVEVVD